MLDACSNGAGVSAVTAPTPTVITAKPDKIQEIRGSDGTTRKLLLFDSGAAVIATEQIASPRAQSGNVWWVPSVDDARSGVLGWIAGCDTNPELHVVRQDGEVHLTVRVGNRPSSPCPAVGVAFEIALTFKSPIGELEVLPALEEAPL